MNQAFVNRYCTGLHDHPLWSTSAHVPNDHRSVVQYAGAGGSIRRPDQQERRTLATEREERIESALRGGDGQSAVVQLAGDLLGAYGDEVPAALTSHRLEGVHS